jgi:uncharacterized protein YajQ (UPF0234 family)
MMTAFWMKTTGAEGLENTNSKKITKTIRPRKTAQIEDSVSSKGKTIDDGISTLTKLPSSSTV